MRENYAYGTELLSFEFLSAPFMYNLLTGLRIEIYILGGGHEKKLSTVNPHHLQGNVLKNPTIGKTVMCEVKT
jgi:hypothetical protein